MKTIKRLFSFILPAVFAAAIMFSSCSESSAPADQQGDSGNTKESSGALKDSPAGQVSQCTSVVPKNALAVGNIDLGSIWNKGEFDNFKNLSTIRKGLEELKREEPNAARLVEGILNNPLSCGLNVKDNIVGFVTKDGNNTFFAASALMYNINDFEGFLNKLAAIDGSEEVLNGETIHEDGITYMIFKRLIVAYNEKRLLFVTTNNYRMSMDYMKFYTSNLFNHESKNSIAQVSSFREYWNNRGDMSAWGSLKNIMSYSLKMKDLDDILPKEMLVGITNLSAYCTFTFENGDLALRLNTIGMPENIKGLTAHRFNSSLIKYMPGNTLAAATLSLNPANIINLISQLAGKDDPMNESIGINNYKVKDVVNAFGGSFAASFFGMVDDEIPAVAIAADITNLNIITNIIEQVGFTKNGDLFTIPSLPFALCIKGNVIIASTDMSVLNKDIEGGYSNGLGNIADKAKDGNYVYVNLDYDRYPSEIKKIIDDELFTHYDYDYDYYTDSYEEFTYHDDEAARAFTEIMRWFRSADARLDNNGLVVKVYTSDNNSNSLSFLINKINNLASRQLK